MAAPNRSAEATLREYVKSRSIFARDGLSIVVDGFRFAKAYQRYLYTELLKNANPESSEGGEALDVAQDTDGGEHEVGAREADIATKHSEPAGLGAVYYFLSHYHSDHYTGLSETWHHGTVCCCEGTAALVKDFLKVSDAHLFTMQLHRIYRGTLKKQSFTSGRLELVSADEEVAAAGDVTLLALDASVFIVRCVSSNHCPASVMFLFYSPTFGHIVHTGDFRYNGTQHSLKMEDAGAHRSFEFEQPIGDGPYLKAICGKVNVLYLDNTYCSPSYRFPLQCSIAQSLISQVQSICTKVLQARASATVGVPCRSVHVGVLIGSYTIGKERLALEVQSAFPCSLRDTSHPHGGRPLPPILVSPEKMRMISAVQFFAQRFQAWGTGECEAPSVKSGDGCSSSASPSPMSSPRAPDNGEGGDCSTVEVLDPPRIPVVFSGCAQKFETELCVTIFLVPMRAIGFKAMKTLATNIGMKRDRDVSIPSHVSSAINHELCVLEKGVALSTASFDHLIGVEPSGFEKKTRSFTFNHRVSRISLPYSEHSSFDELLSFVKLVNPRRIVPTVDEEQFKQHESLFMERASRLLPAFGTVPLTRFFTRSCQASWSGPSSVAEGGIAKTSSSLASDVGKVAKNPFQPCPPSNSSPHGVSDRCDDGVILSSLARRMHSLSSERCSAEEDSDCVLVKQEIHQFVISSDDD